MIPILSLFLSMLRSCFRTRASMQVEILALRHQLAVATRRRKRPSLGSLDRVLWVTLSRFWPRWRAALVTVKASRQREANTDSTLLIYSIEHVRVKVYNGLGVKTVVPARRATSASRRDKAKLPLSYLLRSSLHGF